MEQSTLLELRLHYTDSLELRRDKYVAKTQTLLNNEVTVSNSSKVNKNNSASKFSSNYSVLCIHTMSTPYVT